MATVTIEYLLALLIVLVLVSAFFSASETGMMAINRYRLRHLARSHHHTAKLVSKLLERPERLLGVILIGNTFANIVASAVATVIASHLFGDVGIAVSTVVLTLIILIFGEITPKTLAAHYPQKTAFLLAYPLNFLLKLLYPFVWFANLITSGMLRLFGVKMGHKTVDHLSSEELQTVVKEASGNMAPAPQDMLLRVLELEKVKVDDIMVPRSDIMGIDLNDDWELIKKQLLASQHTRLFLYKDDINNVESVVHLRHVLQLMAENRLSKETLQAEAGQQVHFTPEGTPLTTQLLNFKTHKRRSSLVVDEYGDIQGLITLEDILEEIVGEYTSATTQETETEIHPETGGSFIVLGSVNIRELNREMDWDFATDGAKTLSGLIIEELEAIPTPGLCLRLSGYPIEILEIESNTIKIVRIYPALRRTL